MHDYDRIARVIRYLDAHHTEQPELAALAAHVSLSAFHFHRLFVAWAAITPKDFLQYLTLSHAKDLLREGKTVFDAAQESGLSGPGRLHDLCINVTAASPGELKSSGAGWMIEAGFAHSPFGKCLIAESPRGICHLAFVVSAEGAAEWAALQDAWPNAKLHRDDAHAAELSARIFASPDATPAQPLRAFVRGTAFQVRVWQALLQVPLGKFASYRQLAAAIGSPSAARAVGSAVGRNPLAFLIPCHRVIRETGVVGDYRWGQVRKRAMLVWESGARHGVGDRHETHTEPQRHERPQSSHIAGKPS